jgi:hypothetical protein
MSIVGAHRLQQGWVSTDQVAGEVPAVHSGQESDGSVGRQRGQHPAPPIGATRQVDDEKGRREGLRRGSSGLATRAAAGWLPERHVRQGSLGL